MVHWLDSKHSTATEADVAYYKKTTRWIREIDRALEAGELTKKNRVNFLTGLGIEERQMEAWLELVDVHAANLIEKRRLLTGDAS